MIIQSLIFQKVVFIKEYLKTENPRLFKYNLKCDFIERQTILNNVSPAAHCEEKDKDRV